MFSIFFYFNFFFKQRWCTWVRKWGRVDLMTCPGERVGLLAPYYCSLEYHQSNMCPRSSDPIYIVTYYIEWITTSWTHSNVHLFWQGQTFWCRCFVFEGDLEGCIKRALQSTSKKVQWPYNQQFPRPLNSLKHGGGGAVSPSLLWFFCPWLQISLGNPYLKIHDLLKLFVADAHIFF